MDWTREAIEYASRLEFEKISIGKPGSCRFSILAAIPDNVNPKLYQSLLPDAHIYSTWYLVRAKSMATNGYIFNAIKLLESSGESGSTCATTTSLLYSLERYEKLLTAIRERIGDYPTEVQDVVEAALRRLSFIEFERNGLKSLVTISSEFPKVKELLEKAIIASGLFPQLEEAEVLLNPKGIDSIDPILKDRIHSQPVKPELELISMRDDPKSLKRRITRIMELISIKRQSDITVDISTWLELEKYAELQTDKHLLDMESFCIEELQNLSSL